MMKNKLRLFACVLLAAMALTAFAALSGGAGSQGDPLVTLSYLTELLRDRNPASIRIATLLDKPERRKVDIAPDYVGFTVPDEFVVGYGLDYAELYRNLPYVGILSPSVYESNQ